jgi:alpha-beta hydrolase superfamily lysophospholipase
VAGTGTFFRTFVKRTEDYFEGARGTSLFAQQWMPATSPKAMLAIVHGVTEHSDRYGNIVRPMLAAGIGVAAFDLRGHGRSRGRRGHVDSGRDYLDDLGLFLDKTKRESPCVPLFLFGHSLGSLIALGYIMEHPAEARGVMVCGAAIDPAGVAKPWLVVLARVLAKLSPTLPLPIKTSRTATISRDPKVEADFAADPWRLRTMTARWGLEALALVESVKSRPGAVRLPTLMLHGENDPLNHLPGAAAFFERIPFPDKEMKVYPGGLHEPHNDLDHPQVVRDMLDWIERRL